MNRLACRYAIIRFAPYIETGEFANVGIVLACPATGYFGFKLQDRRTQRVTRFFEHIEGRDYRQALQLFKEELIRIELMAATAGAHHDRVGFIRGLFERLVHPRETVLQFGEPRALMVDDPAQAMENMFQRYVEHDFAERTNREQALLRNVQAFIQTLHIDIPFRPYTIGTETLRAVFPLVQMVDGTEKPGKIIKPFFLAQEQPTEITDHAGNWLHKLRKMRDRRLLPEDVLFAVRGPKEPAGFCHDAYLEVVEDLQALDIQVVEAEQYDSIKAFALR